MKSFKTIHLLPSVIVALGIIAASLAMNFVTGWPLLFGPTLLGIAIVFACIVDTRRNDNVPATSGFVRVFVGAILIGSMLLFLESPTLLKQMIPILGAMAWVSLLQRSSPRQGCN